MDFFIRNFNISIIDNTDVDLLSNKGTQVLEILSDTNMFKWNPTVIIADPFLFKSGNELFLFYERQEKWYGKGRICMRKTSDLIQWSEEVDVLVEPFHLSFPNVFEHNGKIYMLPETGADHSISLYEAEDDTLCRWKLKSKLMQEDIPWYDSTIYCKEGKYYLFTSHDDNIQQTQHLFISDNLDGPYREHPCSPIFVGRDGGRNAGSIIEMGKEMYRPTQICQDSYGEQVSMMKIEKLTPTEYEETLFVDNVINTNILPYMNGGHQFNIVNFKDRFIVATDFRSKNYNVIELFRRVLKHLLY